MNSSANVPMRMMNWPWYAMYGEPGVPASDGDAVASNRSSIFVPPTSNDSSIERLVEFKRTETVPPTEKFPPSEPAMEPEKVPATPPAAPVPSKMTNAPWPFETRSEDPTLRVIPAKATRVTLSGDAL